MVTSSQVPIVSRTPVRLFKRDPVCCDPQGRNLPRVATHAAKASRRNRYYVSKALQTGLAGAHADARPLRIPAGEIEQLVASELASLLVDPLDFAERTRTGRAVRLVHSSGTAATRAEPDIAPIRLVSRAREWRAVIAGGETSPATLPRQEGVMCMRGRHKPSLAAISHRPGGGHKCLCEVCALPLERDDRGKWREAAPLYLQAADGRAANRP